MLLQSEETGYFIPVPEWRMGCPLVVAVLIDLATEDRIDSDLQSLPVAGPAPTGVDEVDSTQHWIERIASKAITIRDLAINRLVKTGVPGANSGAFQTLSSLR